MVLTCEIQTDQSSKLQHIISVRSSRFALLDLGHCPAPLPRSVVNRMKDRHDLKHYLVVTSFAGGNNTTLWLLMHLPVLSFCGVGTLGGNFLANFSSKMSTRCLWKSELGSSFFFCFSLFFDSAIKTHSFKKNFRFKIIMLKCYRKLLTRMGSANSWSQIIRLLCQWHDVT